jgi:hypothetical protein
MSWSYAGHGRSSAVAADAAKRLDAIKCPEPEQTIKGKLGSIIALSLAALPEGLPVKVSASGSQYAPDASKPGEVINSVHLTIEPLSGFLE